MIKRISPQLLDYIINIVFYVNILNGKLIALHNLIKYEQTKLILLDCNRF